MVDKLPTNLCKVYETLLDTVFSGTEWPVVNPDIDVMWCENENARRDRSINHVHCLLHWET